MSISNLDNAMTSYYPHSKVSFIEARELSWRGFYREAGDKEHIIAIDGSEVFGKLLKKCEKIFLAILENTIAEDDLKKLIDLPPTDTWVEDYNSFIISLKTEEAPPLSKVEAKLKRSEGKAVNFKRFYGRI